MMVMMGAVLGVYAAIQACPVPVVSLVHAPAIGFGAALGDVFHAAVGMASDDRRGGLVATGFNAED